MKYSIALTLIKGLSPKLLNELHDIFPNEKELFENMMAKYKFNPNEILDKAEHIKEDCTKNKIKVVNQNDIGYPNLLKNCVDRPYVIYKTGKGCTNNMPCVSIVGTRNNSNYGFEITNNMIKALHEFRVGIVSGLAYGIDIIAHRKANELNIPNFAVLGSGHLCIYPKHHQKELEKIREIGAVISEFPPNTKPTKFNFPKRNRIIAGISHCTVVVESKLKGGGLITAYLAGSYDREVFAIPGNINHTTSEGCNILIKNNRATLLHEFNQIAEELKLKKKESFHKGNIQNKKLSNKEKLVLLCIRSNQPIHVDSIVSKVKLNPSILLALLTQMEINQLIIKKPGNYYATSL